EGPFRPAEELHRHRQPLRGAREPRDPHRHHHDQPGGRRRADRPAPARGMGARPVTPTPRSSDAELAATLAEGAGRRLLDLRASGGLEGKAMGQAGDEVANRYLVRYLLAERPDDGLLSEESKDTDERLGKSRVWIIDPLDGTREFGEHRSDWAVHVGLAIDGVAEVGAVALPGLDGGVVLRSDRPVPLRPYPGPPRMLVSRTRPAAEAVAVAEALG